MKLTCLANHIANLTVITGSQSVQDLKTLSKTLRIYSIAVFRSRGDTLQVFVLHPLLPQPSIQLIAATATTLQISQYVSTLDTNLSLSDDSNSQRRHPSDGPEIFIRISFSITNLFPGSSDRMDDYSYSEKLLMLRQQLTILQHQRHRYYSDTRQYKRVTRQIRVIRERLQQLIERGDSEALQRRT
ncbi:hypothetical protein R3P38DRAFT_3195940 [Favolaschia claudopus]|uniref:Uncharacterized protein n=1 Tax=Favolaschia claudopus TaxID=2862362 RepID=A0AAW0B9D1_9AGAR